MILGIIGLIFAIFVGAAIIYHGWQAVVIFTYSDNIPEFFIQVLDMLTSSWIGIVVLVCGVFLLISKIQDIKTDIEENMDDDDD